MNIVHSVPFVICNLPCPHLIGQPITDKCCCEYTHFVLVVSNPASTFSPDDTYLIFGESRFTDDFPASGHPIFGDIENVYYETFMQNYVKVTYICRRSPLERERISQRDSSSMIEGWFHCLDESHGY